jgi:regulator of RNase E activity RraA
MDVPVTFGEVTFAPGAQLHADEDGVIVLSSSDGSSDG